MTEEAINKTCAELDKWEQKEIWHSCGKGCNCEQQEGHWLDEEMPSYVTSYDAIIPCIQKQPHETRKLIAYSSVPSGAISFMSSPLQLCEALLRAHNKWTE